MAANVQSMVYYGEVPWHGEGISVDKALSFDDALKIGGLAYEVAAREAGYFSPQRNTWYKADGYRMIVRTDNGAVLGQASDSYGIVQNRDAFRFFEPVMEKGEGLFHTAGVLGIGERTWMLAKIPDMTVGGEAHELFLLFTTGHDGRHATEAVATAVRVVCQNTLSAALLGGGPAKISIRHTRNAVDRLAEATRVMNVSRASFDAYKVKGEAMMRIALDDTALRTFLNNLVPLVDDASERVRGQVQEARTLIAGLIAKDAGGYSRPSAWSALNGVTDFVDHLISGRARSRLLYTMEGAGAAMKARAVSILDDIAVAA